MLDERAKLLRPFPVPFCDNPDCGTPLDRDAYEVFDSQSRRVLVLCDCCASSMTRFHPARFKPVT